MLRTHTNTRTHAHTITLETSEKERMYQERKKKTMLTIFKAITNPFPLFVINKTTIQFAEGA